MTPVPTKAPLASYNGGNNGGFGVSVGFGVADGVGVAVGSAFVFTYTSCCAAISGEISPLAFAVFTIFSGSVLSVLNTIS